jgi:nucleoside-diphosphate-sugar epimerase
MEQKKILLIGGTGTISTSVMKLLAKDINYDVTVLNRGHKELPVNIKQIICDIKEPGALEREVAGEKYDVIVDFLIYDAETAAERVRIFSGRVKQYFFISTVVTFDHENIVWLNENSRQTNRFSRYGQNKKAAEDVFRKASASGFPVVIVRPSQTYGEDRIPLSIKGQTCWSVVSRIVNGKSVIVHGDGKSIWHMMHADDFAYNFVQMIGNPAANGQTVNLVNPAVVTWDMIYEEIALQLGKKLRICHISSDTLACAAKYDSIETILGDKQFSNMYSKYQLTQLIPDFRCEIGLKEGVEKYLLYVAEHPECKIEDPEYDAWCDALIRDYRAFMKLVSQKY